MVAKTVARGTRMTKKDMEPDGPGESPRRLSRKALRPDDQISAGLRQLWAVVEQEPLPDEFLDLLDAIDKRRDEGAAR